MSSCVAGRQRQYLRVRESIRSAGWNEWDEKKPTGRIPDGTITIDE
jgi:hypothetical protein